MASMMHNQTPTTENDHIQRIAAACLFSTTSFVGIAGNLLVVTAVALSRQLQTSTNTFVITLAVTDFLNCLFLPVQVLSLVNIDHSTSFLWVCTIVGACLYLFLGISVATLALISFNRFYMITKPRSDYVQLYTKRNIAIMIVTVYGTIASVTIIFAATKLATFGPYEGVCAHAEGDSFTYLSGAWLLLSLIIIIASYCKIYLHVKEHIHRVAALDKSEAERISDDAAANNQPRTVSDEAKVVKPRFVQRQRDLESKITTNMLIIVVLFFICVSPSILTLILPGDQQASAIIIAIISMNSCLNPLVYAWKHPVFRQVFKCILGRKISNISEPSQWVRSMHRI